MSPLGENTKQYSGITLLGVCFAAVAAALILLGAGVIGAGWAVILSIVVILVTSGIAALLNTMKQAATKPGKFSARQHTAAWMITGLFAISIGVMLVLVTLTEPLELIKAALSGVIVLSGTAVTAVLAMLRADAAKDSAEAARAEGAAAKAEAQHAKTAAGGQ